MFYELNSYDPFGASPWKRSEATSGQGTFQGDLSEFAQIHLSLDPDSQLTFEGPAAKSVADLQSNAATSGPIEIRNPLPDGLVIPILALVTDINLDLSATVDHSILKFYFMRSLRQRSSTT